MTVTQRIQPGRRWSEMVIRGDTIYLAGQIATNWEADAGAQADEVFARIDSLLAQAGSGKSEILSMQVWLSDLADYEAFNERYDHWVDPGNKPARATVQAKLIDPRLKVEVMVVAARSRQDERGERLTAARLVEKAQAEIEFVEVEQAADLLAARDVVVVDVRHADERATGCIPGSVHAPRGMLEWAMDPSTEFHMPVFASGKRLVFVCGSGGRSSLATKLACDMGLAAACLRGGMKAWIVAGAPVVSPDS